MCKKAAFPLNSFVGKLTSVGLAKMVELDQGHFGKVQIKYRVLHMCLSSFLAKHLEDVVKTSLIHPL